MEIDVRTHISSDFTNIEVQINAPKITEEVQMLEEKINRYKGKIRKIVGKQNNNYFIICISDIIKFYTKGKYNYCKTKTGDFRIREKLYYLEDVLPQETFLRISNSTILNIEYVELFNTDIIGKIIIKMKDGTEEESSFRRNTKVIKFLKNIK